MDLNFHPYIVFNFLIFTPCGT